MAEFFYCCKCFHCFKFNSDGFTANTLTYILDGISKVARISGTTSHNSRLGNLAKCRVGVRTLMALAGHSNMTIKQRYIDFPTALLNAVVDLV